MVPSAAAIADGAAGHRGHGDCVAGRDLGSALDEPGHPAHFMPRMRIRYTSAAEIGQIYMPVINWMLLVLVICVVLAFKKSDNLAAAYGIAVTTTMVITTFLAALVMRNVWKWNPALVTLIS
jgi:K+ transporter